MKLKLTMHILFLFACFGCSTKNKEKDLLLESIRKNMDIQIGINKQKMKNWKLKDNAYPDYVGPADSSISNMIETRNKLFYQEKMSTEDFNVSQQQKAVEKRLNNSKYPYDSLVPYKENLSLRERIELFTFSSRYTELLTEIHHGHFCGYTLCKLKPYVITNEKILLIYEDTVMTTNGTITFHFKNATQKTIAFSDTLIEGNAWKIGFPKDQKVIAIAWTDSLHNQKRTFTWPSYEDYRP